MRTPDDTPIDSAFLQTCDIPADELRLEPCTMVIFGGAGDLSRRKLLPAIYRLLRGGEIPAGFAVLGFDRAGLTEEEYRAAVKEEVRRFSADTFEERSWDDFGRILHYLKGDISEDGVFQDLAARIDVLTTPTGRGSKEVIYYLAVPPRITPAIVHKLKRHSLHAGKFHTKIVVEKPFGHDRASAAALNRILTGVFEEEQIYRIDHYLAKDPVQNILFLRFSNAIFAEIWNHQYIDNVQITAAEEIGIGNRGAFYDGEGVVRDIVQNHVLQILGLITMEAPIAFKADFIREEKSKIVRSIRPMDDEYLASFTVRGQYGKGKVGDTEMPAYRSERDVQPDSPTPTFFAAKLYIDNLRWAGVPFYVRAGKRMARRVTEICLQFKRLPLRLLGRTCDTMEPNILVLTIQPDEKISLRFGVKYPYSDNQIYPVNMVFSYGDTFRTRPLDPYERLLIDCMKGDLTLFVREDVVEEMWGVVDSIISRWEEALPADFPNYRAGTWGPREANLLLEREGRRWITE